MTDDNNSGGSNNNGAANASSGEVQIQIPSGAPKAEGTQDAPSGSSGARNWRRWFIVAIDILFLIAGQTSAALLGRYYYSQGGSSKWVSTFVQTAGFPILFFGLFFFPSKSSSTQGESPVAKTALVYIVLGLIIAADDMMYSSGLHYLPVSTYSLICATQLAFGVVFSYVLNSQKLSGLIFNSVFLLTLSDLLIGVSEESDDESTRVSRGKYLLGVLLTLGASGTYSLILSLMQLTFENVIKRRTFSAVLNMQIYTSLVATFASLIGLVSSGEWKSLKQEMDTFKSGQFSYLMTLVWSSVSWQMASLGMVGLIFEVSSLFSNVIGTFAIPIIPFFGVMIFQAKMNGVKVIAILISLWGFVSYVYYHHLEDKKARKAGA